MILYHGSDTEVKNPRIIKKEDALERLKFQKINSQVAFCNEESLELLKFVGSFEVK